MSVLGTRDYYKPFDYPWAYEAYKKSYHAMHWGPSEVPMADDISDWQFKLTDSERALLTQVFRFFVTADVDIAGGYIDRYMRRFKKPELRMMLGAIVAAEANHVDAYALLIDTLGLPEVEYSAFADYGAMREKHEYMHGREIGTSIADLIVDLAVFSAFGEGMQLFSTFALLMNFQRHGLMKGMATIIEWTIKDETLHVASMARLLQELIKEHPRAWNDDTKKRIYDAARAMVRLEDSFIDLAFSLGPVRGITAADCKTYIRYLADRRLLQIGLKPNWKQKTNPFPWLDELTALQTHTNFFEQRSTEYGKGGLTFSPDAFDFGPDAAEFGVPVNFEG